MENMYTVYTLLNSSSTFEGYIIGLNDTLLVLLEQETKTNIGSIEVNVNYTL